MTWNDDPDAIFEVVINHEEQYSIWNADRDPPAGWTKVGVQGKKQVCLDEIEKRWTDMRPQSLRRWMDEQEAAVAEPEPEEEGDDNEVELVDRLCEGEHPVEVALRPKRSAEAFREAISRGVVHLRFGETQGGTELGVRIDESACNVTEADFETGSGVVHLKGTLSLDWTPVRCFARIDVESLRGEGHLKRV
jgi:uncharacterized protein YbdZ (MbtH family)